MKNIVLLVFVIIWVLILSGCAFIPLEQQVDSCSSSKTSVYTSNHYYNHQQFQMENRYWINRRK